MSPTPPISSGPRSAGDSSSNAAGDGVELSVVEARGAQRTGAIWILIISLTLAVVVLGGYWLTQASKMQAVNHPAGRDLNTKDVGKLYSGSAGASATNSAVAN